MTSNEKTENSNIKKVLNLYSIILLISIFYFYESPDLKKLQIVEILVVLLIIAPGIFSLIQALKHFETRLSKFIMLLTILIAITGGFLIDYIMYN